MSTTPSSANYAKDIWQKDKDHFTHPWQVFDSFEQEGSMIMEHAGGAYLTDIEGNRYLDGVGGLWCTNIGQGREEMAEAIAEQVRKLAYASPFVDMTTTPAAELASKLADLAPGDLDHVLYSCGGSTAIDSAYRLIQFYQNCRGMRTYIAMSIGGKKADHPPEFDYERDTIHHISSPNFYRAKGYETEDAFLNFLVDELEQKILELGADKVAAQKHDVLYVSDEVVTAFGRLGHWFASEDVFGFVPDIITCAKGLSSGYLPIGATIYSDRIHSVISEQGKGRYFANGYTYSGHPVCCAAALKNLEIMERENIFANAIEVGDYFGQQLQTLTDLPIVGEVRGYRLMQCVEFVANKETKELFPEEMDIGKVVSDIADKKGLLVRPIVHLNVMSPPLIITKEEVDFAVKTLRESIIEASSQINHS